MKHHQTSSNFIKLHTEQHEYIKLHPHIYISTITTRPDGFHGPAVPTMVDSAGARRCGTICGGLPLPIEIHILKLQGLGPVTEQVMGGSTGGFHEIPSIGGTRATPIDECFFSNENIRWMFYPH